MKKHIEKVYDWHRKFKLDYPEEFTRDLSRKEIRQKLIDEELGEFFDAIKNDPESNVYKEAADLLYVVFGTFHAFGLNLDLLEKVFDEVHESNLTKLDKDGNPIKRADGKILKSELYKKPNLKQFFKDE